MMKDNDNALKQKGLLSWWRHGGMACMAQKYHGHEDVNGLFRKIGNTSVTYVNEWKVCYMGKEMEGPKVTCHDDVGAILSY
jgi:hypothetical protein